MLVSVVKRGHKPFNPTRLAHFRIMQSNTTQLFGYRLDSSMEPNTRKVTNVENYHSQWKFRRVFTCANGNVQGNKRSPNPNSYTYYSIDHQNLNQHTTWSHANGRYWFLVSTNTAGSPWALDLSTNTIDGDNMFLETRDRSLEKIFEQMRYGKGNLAVDLAESRETIKMIKNMTSVRKMVRNTVREIGAKRGTASSRLKFSTEKWLGFRYGVMPLVYSTYELLETLSRKVNAKASTVRINAMSRRVRERHDVQRLPGSYTTRVHQYDGTFTAQTQICVLMRARTTLEVYDFTSLNPVGIAWELVPLSFVADWFVNVGQCLSLWEDYILFANRFVSGFQTQVGFEDVAYKSYERFAANPPTWPDGQEWNGYVTAFSDIRNARRRWCSKTRTVLASLPTPGGPRVRVKLNAKRCLDAAALIRAAFT